MSNRENLKIDHVQIHTASLSIRHFMVSNRKMTLSVFRQIMPEQIINEETMELRGVPWGKVNYFWDGAYANSQGYQFGEAKMIHVVWQKADELRRCVLSGARIAADDVRTANNEIDGYVVTSDARQRVEDVYPDEGRGLLMLPSRKARLTVSLKKTTSGYRYSDFYLDADIPEEIDSMPHKEKAALTQGIVKNAKAKLIAAEIDAATKRIKKAERFNQLHASLCELPQIYIAV